MLLQKLQHFLHNFRAFVLIRSNRASDDAMNFSSGLDIWATNWLYSDRRNTKWVPKMNSDLLSPNESKKIRQKKV